MSTGGRLQFLDTEGAEKQSEVTEVREGNERAFVLKFMENAHAERRAM